MSPSCACRDLLLSSMTLSLETATQRRRAFRRTCPTLATAKESAKLDLNAVCWACSMQLAVSCCEG